MKALREFLIVILSMFLVGSITCLGVLISFKNIVNTSFVSAVAETMLMEQTGMSKEDKEKIEESIDKIKSYDGTQDVIDSFFDDVNNSKDGNIVVSDETIDKFIKALEDNKKDLINLGVKEEDIDNLIKEVKDPKNREELQKGINESYKELSLDSNESSSINLIKTYGSIVSPETITKMGLSIAVLVMLIGFLSWSPYKWIRPTSISTIIAGINLLALYFGIDAIIKMVTSENGVNFDVDTSVLKSLSWSIFIGGIVALVVYIVINAIVKRRKNALAGNNNMTLNDIPAEVHFGNPNNKTIVKTETTTETRIIKNDMPVDDASVTPEKFCSACGGGLPKDAKVCSHCGAPLE